MSNFKMYDKVLYLGEQNTYECIYVCQGEDLSGDAVSIIEVSNDNWLLSFERDEDVPEDYKSSIDDRYLKVYTAALMKPMKEQEEPKTLERLVTSLQERIKSGYNKEQEEPKTFEKLYIKFEEGNQESLDRACKEAERLGYKKWIDISALNFRLHGILRLTTTGIYYTSEVDEKNLIDKVGYKEHKIEDIPTEDGIWRYRQGTDIGYTFSGTEKNLVGRGIEDINEVSDECCTSEDTKKEPCLQSPYLYLFT